MSSSTRALSSSPYAGALETATDLVDRFGTITTPTPETVAAAQRTVAGHLQDPAAVAEVLAMLGIPERVA